MKKKLLDRVVVRPVAKSEEARFARLMDKHHYLAWGRPVGERMLYVATVGKRWVALLMFGAAAYALKDRDAWLEWQRHQRQGRLNFITQNRRFLILPDVREQNLASKILSIVTKRLADDWDRVYGHPVWAVETFVDPQRFEGTCYKAAGWQQLGFTVGAHRRARRDFYDESGSPKQLFVKALRKDAKQLLCADELPQCWRKYDKEVVLRSAVKTAESRSLLETFKQVRDFRKARGKRHHLATILACAACAVLAGAEGIGQIAEIIAGFDQRHLRAMRCYRNNKTKRYVAPAETCLRTVLGGIDPEQFDTILAQWVREQQQQPLEAIAFDGKALKGCLDSEGRPLFLVGAVGHENAGLVGQVQVDSKSNEVPAARELLRQMPDIDGVMATADAAHANAETARVIVLEKGCDYLLPLKGNQPTILKAAETLLPVRFFSLRHILDREISRSA